MHFPSVFEHQKIGGSFVENACVDLAIDAYLLGAEFSRFGYYGESEVSVRRRCKDEFENQVNHLYDQLSGWFVKNSIDDNYLNLCDEFILFWWENGFQEGGKRYRMKLQ